MSASPVRVIRVGWRAFEGFGRPFEGWYEWAGFWICAGRAFTEAGARRKARALRRWREKPQKPKIQQDPPNGTSA